MATVAYSSAHTPYQQPPTSLLPAGSLPTGAFDCLGSPEDQRVLSNQMIEAMDAEIGRVLVETGIATRGPDGSLRYDPERSDTMIVIMGDNGTYAPGVKAPFNPLRAKATVYQTGVWVPLIVAGPLVKAPGREVRRWSTSPTCSSSSARSRASTCTRWSRRRVRSIRSRCSPISRNATRRA